jgi:uncharacterized protein YijF (DUF1287 family)
LHGHHDGRKDTNKEFQSTMTCLFNKMQLAIRSLDLNIQHRMLPTILNVWPKRQPTMATKRQTSMAVSAVEFFEQRLGAGHVTLATLNATPNTQTPHKKQHMGPTSANRTLMVPV